MKNRLITPFLCLLYLNASASSEKLNLKDQISVGLGMVSLGLNQNESAFNDDKNITTGSVSNISLDVNYEYFSKGRRSHAFRIIGSGFAGETSKYYSIGYANRFYFGGEGTKSMLNDQVIKIEVRPKFRYFLGYNLNTVSIVYETDTEVRSDILLEVGANAGVLYGRRGDNGSYKFELAALKSNGIETSGFNFQFFFGTSYYIDSIF